MALIYLRSVGVALRAAHNHITFIACFEGEEMLFCKEEISQLAQEIILVDNELSPLVISSLKGKENADAVWVVGSSDLLRSIQKAREHELNFASHTLFRASVYGPMQCMMKGVCAQCLQWQIDPKSGQRTKAVYACSWHNQPLEMIDIHHLEERLVQNQMQEQLSNLWLDYLQLEIATH